MTMPLEPDSRPPYVQAAEVLRAAIEQGELTPGEKLPSARDLQRRFGIASSTVQNALRLLKDEGLIYSVQGRGSYVRASGQGAESGQAGETPVGEASPPIDDPRPPYQQAADTIREWIEGGELAPGDQLPSARALQDHFAIANSTAQNALRVLKDEGLIFSVQGRGVFVGSKPPPFRYDQPNSSYPSPSIGTSKTGIASYLAGVEQDRQRALRYIKTSNEELAVRLEEAKLHLEQAKEEVRALKAEIDRRKVQSRMVASANSQGLLKRLANRSNKRSERDG
jgi:DNA-binding GntR family transcriptional regulator